MSGMRHRACIPTSRKIRCCFCDAFLSMHPFSPGASACSTRCIPPDASPRSQRFGPAPRNASFRMHPFSPDASAQFSPIPRDASFWMHPFSPNALAPLHMMRPSGCIPSHPTLRPCSNVSLRMHPLIPDTLVPLHAMRPSGCILLFQRAPHDGSPIHACPSMHHHVPH
jgi:hypothetical protein